MIEVLPVPALRDNYIWVIHDGRHAVVVDPGESAPILAWLTGRGMSLTAILVTHHHGDHVGGVADLAACYGCPVHGPGDEPIPCLTDVAREGSLIRLAAPELTIRILEVPGHTRGHLAYLGAGHLFCGDTLFSCGCGRVFEGTPAQMHRSLSKLAALPDDTWVCCAHEYTLANIAFAQYVDPDNEALAQRASVVGALRAEGRPTLPVRLSLERLTNPFLRCDQAPILAAVGHETGRRPPSPEQAFAALRAMKDRFQA
ncbi:MAG: hydroxyacylglutathione hydrolase [Thiobacillaceae bacterium]|jgi:hydroxyacylglutathione hydrolase|nr:hydroxyacylglutathione hydrolase [Thiobacillaceae bacterium]